MLAEQLKDHQKRIARSVRIAAIPCGLAGFEDSPCQSREIADHSCGYGSGKLDGVFVWRFEYLHMIERVSPRHPRLRRNINDAPKMADELHQFCMIDPEMSRKPRKGDKGNGWPLNCAQSINHASNGIHAIHSGAQRLPLRRARFARRLQRLVGQRMTTLPMPASTRMLRPQLSCQAQASGIEAGAKRK